MSAWIPLAIGGGLGLLRYMEAKKEAPRKRKIEETKARYYPWLRLAPETVDDPSLMENVLGGAMGGSQVASNLGLKLGGGEADVVPMEDFTNPDVPPPMEGEQQIVRQEHPLDGKIVGDDSYSDKYLKSKWFSPSQAEAAQTATMTETTFKARPDQHGRGQLLIQDAQGRWVPARTDDRFNPYRPYSTPWDVD